MIECTVIMIAGLSLELCIMVLVEKWALLMYDPTMSLVYPTNLICNDNENQNGNGNENRLNLTLRFMCNP